MAFDPQELERLEREQSRWERETLGDHLENLATTKLNIAHRSLFKRLPEYPLRYDRQQQKLTVLDPTLRVYLYRNGSFD